jgi:hypothetical protein
MQIRTIPAFAACAVLGVCGTLVADQPAASTPAPSPQPPAKAPEQPAAVHADSAPAAPPARQPPLIRVYRTPAPADAETPKPNEASAPTQTAAPDSSVTGAITVPGNTLGPGTPLWLQRELAAAQLREAQANALIAEREAQRSRFVIDDERRGGVIVFGPHGRYVTHGIERPYTRFLRRGPVNGAAPMPGGVAIDRSNLSAAQRNFADAASPRIAPIIEGQQDAQRRFGQIAPPPIAPIINAQQEAQRAIQRPQ